MEKDETVSDSSPHIANIGRLVEVSAVKPPQLEPAAGSLLHEFGPTSKNFVVRLLLSLQTSYSCCIKSNSANVAQCLMAQYSSYRVFQQFVDMKMPLCTLSPARYSNNLPAT